MRRLLAAVLALAVVPAFAGVKTTNDRFTQHTKVEMGPATTKLDAVQMHAIWTQETESKKPLGAEIFFLSSSQGWKYLQCHNIDWLLDGKPFKMPDASRAAGKVMSAGYVVEILSVKPVDLETFDKIANAQSIEFRVCNDEFRASAEDVENLREFAKQIHAIQ